MLMDLTDVVVVAVVVVDLLWELDLLTLDEVVLAAYVEEVVVVGVAKLSLMV